MCTLGAIHPFKDGGSFLDDGKPFPSKMVKLLASKLSIKVVKDFPNRSSSKTHRTFGSTVGIPKNAVWFSWCVFLKPLLVPCIFQRIRDDKTSNFQPPEFTLTKCHQSSHWPLRHRSMLGKSQPNKIFSPLTEL